MPRWFKPRDSSGGHRGAVGRLVLNYDLGNRCVAESYVRGCLRIGLQVWFVSRFRIWFYSVLRALLSYGDPELKAPGR